MRQHGPEVTALDCRLQYLHILRGRVRVRVRDA